MASLTGHTKCRRRITKRRAGRAAKRKRFEAGTPAFPIHPEGYDPKAADAKPAAADAGGAKND